MPKGIKRNRPKKEYGLNVGDTFGTWTITGTAVIMLSGGGNKEHYPCRCICGTDRFCLATNLVGGKSKNCGCLRKPGGMPLKHGAAKALRAGHPLARTYLNIIQRCYNPKNPAYEHYGQRGIKVCDRWLQSFQHFSEDMGPRPSDEHSVDRINNDGPYSPENCKWATDLEQANNKRSNHRITWNGVTMTIRQWSRHFGINPWMVESRLLQAR